MFGDREESIYNNLHLLIRSSDQPHKFIGFHLPNIVAML